MNVDKLNEIKAIVLYILKSFPNGIDSIKLNELMYLSYKKHLVLYARGICDEVFVINSNGHIPQFTQDVLNIDGIIKKLVNNRIIISSELEPDMDELSVSDIKVLDEIINLHGSKCIREINKLCRFDVAYFYKWTLKSHFSNGIVLSDIDIAKAGGASQWVIEYITAIMMVKKSLGLTLRINF